MGFVYTNPNPDENLTGDCVIRAISLVTGKDWETVFVELMVKGFSMHDMPSSNVVWSNYLWDNGFQRKLIPNTCPKCYRVRDFIVDHPYGEFILATGTHVIAVKDGNYYDT